MDLNKAATLMVPGLPTLTGLAGMIYGILIITDCTRFQTKVGECDGTFKSGSIAIGLGLSGILGSIGGFITKNPWLRDSAVDLMGTVIEKLDDIGEKTAQLKTEPPVMPIFNVPQNLTELSKDEIISKVSEELHVDLTKKLSKEELIETALAIYNLGVKK